VKAQDACLECHSLPGQEVAFGRGETRSATLDPDRWSRSAHGQGGLECSSCHTEHTEYPHPARPEVSARSYTLAANAVCEGCHDEQAKKSADGVHHALRQGGNEGAAVCTDCHDPHAGERLTDPATGKLRNEARVGVPRTCSRCHSAIDAKYRESAHGAALLGEGNLDVPTCIDCHAVHSTPDPRTARFRQDTPKLCAA
jgi:hypothetical protein